MPIVTSVNTCNKSVRRRHYNIRLRILSIYLPRSIRYAGRRIPRNRLLEDVLPRHMGQLLRHHPRIPLRSHHPEMLNIAHRQKPLHRHLQQRLPCPQHVDELLGMLRSTQRPQAAADDCLGCSGVLNGHRRLPMPPAMMTILVWELFSITIISSANVYK